MRGGLGLLVGGALLQCGRGLGLLVGGAHLQTSVGGLGPHGLSLNYQFGFGSLRSILASITCHKHALQKSCGAGLAEPPSARAVKPAPWSNVLFDDVEHVTLTVQ